MAMTKDGKHKSSKFRAARYDKEHEGDEKPAKPESEMESEEEEAGSPHARASVNKMNAKHSGNPEQHGFGGSTHGEHTEPDGDEGGGAEGPGGADGAPDHAEIKQIAAEHGPAHTIHMMHDHANSTSHVHSIHADGHEHHHDHAHPDHVMHAHHHAMHAAGTPPLAMAEPEEHEQGMGGGADDEEGYSQPL